MKENIKDVWLAALRSGEYKQGIGSLKEDNRYCCLGVLCDLAAKDGIGDWCGKMFHDTDGYKYNFDDFILTDGVRIWAGMRDRSGYFPETHPYRGSLSEVNDAGVPFPQIANLIEQCWESL